MLTLRRIILSVLLMALLLVAAFPGIVYIVGICRVEGRPTPATPEIYTQETVEKAWINCNETLPVQIKPINPWAYAYKFIFGNPLHKTPGERAAWRIASTHNAAHRTGNTWWYTSGVALSIWITRQWSAQEIAATLVRDNLCKRKLASASGSSLRALGRT